MWNIVKLAVISSIYRASDRRKEQETEPEPLQADLQADPATEPTDPVNTAQAENNIPLDERQANPSRIASTLPNYILAAMTALRTGTRESAMRFRSKISHFARRAYSSPRKGAKNLSSIAGFTLNILARAVDETRARYLFEAAKASLYALSDIAQPKQRVTFFTILLDQCIVLLAPGNNVALLFGLARICIAVLGPDMQKRHIQKLVHLSLSFYTENRGNGIRDNAAAEGIRKHAILTLRLLAEISQVNELFHLWDSHVVQDLKRVLLESDQDSSTRTVAKESLEAVQKMEAATAASARSWLRSMAPAPAAVASPSIAVEQPPLQIQPAAASCSRTPADAISSWISADAISNWIPTVSSSSWIPEMLMGLKKPAPAPQVKPAPSSARPAGHMSAIAKGKQGMGKPFSPRH